MAPVLRSCLQLLLKVVNSVIGIVGIAMILYGLWMIRVWQRNMDGSSFDDFNSTFPWFIYTFLGIAITLCVITCAGHIAADTANGCCLSCYMMIIFLLLLLETAMTADIILNHNWEKDVPEDPTGRFDDFKDFVKSNFEIFEWIGLLIVLAQGLSILLAMVLRTLGPYQGSNYDSDDDYAPARLPLLNHPVPPPPYVVGDLHFASKNDAWNVKINEKTYK